MLISIAFSALEVIRR